MRLGWMDGRWGFRAGLVLVCGLFCCFCRSMSDDYDTPDFLCIFSGMDRGEAHARANFLDTLILFESPYAPAL